MNSKSVDYSQPPQDGRKATRRRLLALLGLASGASVVGQVAGTQPAAAANGDPLLLGRTDNEATDITAMRADVPTVSFAVRNESDGQWMKAAIEGSSKYGVGLHGRSEGDQPGVAAYSARGPAVYISTDTGDAIHANGFVGVNGARDGYILGADNTSDASGSGGILARSYGGQEAVFGVAMGQSNGVAGHASSGIGVYGYAESGYGIYANSVSGTGAHFESASGTALEVRNGPTDMSWTSTDPTLVVNNHGSGKAIEGVSDTGIGIIGRHTSTEPGDESATGVFGESTDGSGVLGRAVTGTGVQAQCANGNGVVAFGGTPDNGPSDDIHGIVGFGFQGYGVMGQTEQASKAGVLGEAVRCIERGPCDNPAAGTGVLGRSEVGIGVRGESTGGPGVEAVSADGLALRVAGRAGFATAGSGVIAAGQSSGSVTDARVTQHSHISVTLTSDPGSRALHWVQGDAGNGFTVHLTVAPANKRPRTTFTYLITESAG